MRFGDMHDRIILLRPCHSLKNDMNETVPAWVPFCPYLPDMTDEPPVLTLTDGDFEVRYADGMTADDASKYRIWAKVTPVSGREYTEMQKIRAEQTYKVKIRYADGVLSNFKILYRDRILHVESVIESDGAGRELILDCWEVDTYGKAD